MGKFSRDSVFDTLKWVCFFSLLVFGSTASQEQGCCGIGGGSSGSGDSGGAGGEGGSPVTETCFDYANFDGLTPAVTFKNDVLPIFRKSCGLDTSCHGAQMGPAGQPYLGPPLGPTVVDAQIMQIFMENVNAPSAKASTMKIIEPGKPEASFLMHKVDDTLKCEAVVCDVDCGVAMPKAQTMLSPADRDKVRRWIAQGAKND